MTSAARTDPLLGEVLDDRYRIDALLGQGGMGAVYRATHVGLHREVAVKVLHPEIARDGQIAKRFEREAHSASRLDHPHCVRVTDFGATSSGVTYLVMELLTGCELTKRLGQPWPWADAVKIAEQVLEGLIHAHHHGIVHRDLKPENVFLATDFKGQEIAKIVDFGIAKLLDGDGGKEALTRAGMVFGTPRYMSPEQAAGGKIDERTDLYALGIIFYEMLAGDAPFDAEELPALLRMQIMAPPPPLPEHVPAELAAFVGKLLEKSRHDRFESATIALVELRALVGRLSKPNPPASQVADTLPPVVGDGIPSAITDARSLVGTMLVDRYRLDAMLGEGGMGAVFRARHVLMERDVAVKILHPELGRDPEISARFDREAQTAARLEHPNIVSVLEFGGTPAGFRYLVMPLLTGAELRTMTGRPMDPARAIGLAIQLFAALEHAHARAVVHRDLKPENVFVLRPAEGDRQGREQLKLVDFGLAKLAEGASTGPALTRIGQVFGTPAYMSPEQARGEAVDARTDLYSAGLILYELLAGRLPFTDDDVVVLLQRQIHDPPPPLPESIDPRLRELVMRLLAKDRAQRIPDASTAKAMLETLAAGLPGPLELAGMPTLMETSSSSRMAMNSMNSMNSMVGPGGPSLAQRIFDNIPRKWLYVAGGVLGVLVVIAAWPSSSDDEDESQAQDATGEGGGKPASVGDRKPLALPFGNSAQPDESVYIEIDRLLSAKSKDAALDRIRVARDEFTDDAGLLWREGQALALSKTKSDRQTALRRYGEAVDADPTLVDQTNFQSQLYGLLHEPALRDSAIDLAVQKLGTPAHGFLLELINVEDPKQALSWVDRHRVLDALTSEPESLVRVDSQLNLARDLYQAKDAPQPCTAFAATLDAIAARNEAYFVEHTTSKAVGIPTSPGTGEDESACEGLTERFEALGNELSSAYPDEAERVEKSRSGRKKGGGGGGWPF